MPNPKVSIVIPSYNHKRYIGELLASIAAQTYQNIETIVIDDGSTDGSAQYLTDLQSKYLFRLVVKQNEGLCATVNRGLDETTGEYICIIASDDFIPADRIERQVREIQATGADVIAGKMTVVGEDSRPLQVLECFKYGWVTFDEMAARNLVFAPTAMISAHIYKKLGKYNPDFVTEDYSMWLKVLASGGKILNVDFNWAFYRTNPQSSRKKIDWYYKGVVQSLLQYRSNPAVEKSIRNHKFKYAVKVMLVDSDLRKFNVSNIEPVEIPLSFLQKGMLFIIYYLPSALKKILRKKFLIF